VKRVKLGPELAPGNAPLLERVHGLIRRETLDIRSKLPGQFHLLPPLGDQGITIGLVV
jgi:hypothetical protein